MDLFCDSTERMGSLDVNTLSAYFCVRPGEDPAADSSFHLRYRGGVLSLGRNDDPRGVAVSKHDIERRLKGDFALGRACGIRRGRQLRILDATAGLGIDGLTLAMMGQDVLMVERVPALWAMLSNLIDRLPPIDARVQLADCAAVFAAGAAVFDVIYFDPMFQPRTNKALPGKRMQYVAALLGDELPFDLALVEQARSQAARVVLKRRLKDPLAGIPDWQIKGRTVRYDVFRGRGDAALEADRGLEAGRRR